MLLAGQVISSGRNSNLMVVKLSKGHWPSNNGTYIRRLNQGLQG